MPPGRYELICPPVKIAASDGAPCVALSYGSLSAKKTQTRIEDKIKDC